MKKVLYAVLVVIMLAGIGISWNANKKETIPVGLCVPVSGITNASGVFAYMFPNPYIVAPNIQVNVLNGNDKYNTITTVSTTGFTGKVVQRSAVTLLGIEVLLAATTNVVAAPVDVLLTAKQ